MQTLALEKKRIGAAEQRSEEDNDMPKTTGKIWSGIKLWAHWNKWHWFQATAKASSQHVSPQVLEKRNQQGGSQTNHRGSLWITGHHIGTTASCKGTDEGTTPLALSFLYYRQITGAPLLHARQQFQFFTYSQVWYLEPFLTQMHDTMN